MRRASGGGGGDDKKSSIVRAPALSGDGIRNSGDAGGAAPLDSNSHSPSSFRVKVKASAFMPSSPTSTDSSSRNDGKENDAGGTRIGREKLKASRARIIKSLEGYVKEHRLIGDFDADHDVERRTREIFDKRRAQEVAADPTLAAIPRFFRSKSLNETHKLLRRLARTRQMQRYTGELLNEEDLERLAELLTDNTSPAPNEGDSGLERINWDSFCIVASFMPEKAGRFFTPATFLQFRRDRWGRISTHRFFQYVCHIITLCQTRIQLAMYDTDGSGYLREQDFENYIYELIPDLKPLEGLQENFHPFFVFTAVRKFFFFLDPRRTGKIAIKDVVTSFVHAELMDLRSEWDDDDEDRNASNWFSAPNALRVYSQYLELDIDHNGMLSKDELMSFGMGSMTHVIVERVFEECHTYDGEIDYKTFLDFVLAVENKKSPQSLGYFFRLLDIKKCGYLDIFCINYFFREIIKRMEQAESVDVVNVEDVKDEIFDMVKPEHPHRITLADLIRCGVGDTVVNMLTDIKEFWTYDNRENLIGEADDDEEDDSGDAESDSNNPEEGQQDQQTAQ